MAIASSRGSSWPRDWAHISCIDIGFLTTGPPGKPLPCLLSLHIFGWGPLLGLLVRWPSQVFPFRLYLNLVLGNVNVTLLSNQAKWVSQAPLHLTLWNPGILLFQLKRDGTKLVFALKKKCSQLGRWLLVFPTVSSLVCRPPGGGFLPSFTESVCGVDWTASFPWEMGPLSHSMPYHTHSSWDVGSPGYPKCIPFPGKMELWLFHYCR